MVNTPVTSHDNKWSPPQSIENLPLHQEAITEHYFIAPAAEVVLYHDAVSRDAIGGQYMDMPKGYYTSIGFIGTVIGACLANISGYLGWVVPANTLLLINQSLGGSRNIIWVALAYTTGFTVGMALLGRLSDIFGRLWFFIGYSVITLIGNIIGASAQPVNSLIVTNTPNGLGGAGQLSFSVLVGELMPNRQRGPWNAAILFSCVPFAVFSPPIAQPFIENTVLQWRWSYILDCIINALAVAGGQSYPWVSSQVLCTLIIGIMTLVAFRFWEAYSGHEYPLIPMRLFRNIKYDAIVACAGIAAMVYYPMSVLWPTVIGSGFTTDVTGIGWLSCAVGGGISLGEFAGGLGVRYIPRMKLQIVVAAMTMAGPVAAIASSSEHTRTRTVRLPTTASTAARYMEALCLSSMALVWEPEDIGFVAGVLGLGANSLRCRRRISIHVRPHKQDYKIPALLRRACRHCRRPACFLSRLTFRRLKLWLF
ncbi:MFS general substrate transporter [Lepidopterella palustris CBS 459.81]|uniref:MFS general substrate transporter n=1 Tax=Lepidopterella palustris CBS 459.81 TaxID=1314670 RepID=A0A8E2E7I8_9PEZI|nr:MFS general substrate transporter [Lepidopterella palustris CBS 459.81]